MVAPVVSPLYLKKRHFSMIGSDNDANFVERQKKFQQQLGMTCLKTLSSEELELIIKALLERHPAFIEDMARKEQRITKMDLWQEEDLTAELVIFRTICSELGFRNETFDINSAFVNLRLQHEEQ